MPDLNLKKIRQQQKSFKHLGYLIAKKKNGQAC